MAWNTFPFMVMTLAEYYCFIYKTSLGYAQSSSSRSSAYTPEIDDHIQTFSVSVRSSNPWVRLVGNGGIEIFKKIKGGSSYTTYLVKLYPPMGYLCVGDLILTTRYSGSGSETTEQIFCDGQSLGLVPKDLFTKSIVVFVKDDPLYSIRCNGEERVVNLTDGGNGKCNSDSEYAVWFATASDSYGVAYKLKTTDPNYIAPGCRWATTYYAPSDPLRKVRPNISFYGAINRKYIENVTYKINKNIDWYWDGGSRVGSSVNTSGGCDFDAFSSVAFYKRDGPDEFGNPVKNGSILDESGDTEISSGKLTYTSVFISTPQNFDWRDDDGLDTLTKVLYIIRFEDTNRLCCLGGGSMGGAECGLGLNRIQPSSSVCSDMFRRDCKFDSPYFTKDYCLKHACRNNVSSSNPISCDYEIKKFCGDNRNNYLKYPDICGCFMSTKTLKPECDSMADSLSIRNNKPAKFALNIDTDDPLQCNQNCAVHPICRQMTVPISQGYPSAREGKYIQRGSIQDKSACPEKNLCVQTATVNLQGKIGSLSIKQDANCGSYKSKLCQNSVLSKCIYQISEGEFVKQVITEKDGGACSSSLESLSCASFNLTPTDLGCTNDSNTLRFDLKKEPLNPDDAVDAIKSLLSDELKALNPTIKYDKDANSVIVISPCQDCEMDYELTGSCFLEGNQWKIKGKKTKVKKQPLNGGKVCVIDNTEKTIDCPSNADCSVTVKKQDSGCKDEKRSIEFNITSLTSGNGKSCDDVILPLLPQLYKNNPVSVAYSSDKKTLTASIPCKDCIVDYKIDPTSNNGECYFDGTRNVINKIPFLKRQPLNGGVCSTELLNAIRNKTPKIEECSFDQDCKFKSEPSSVGNCIGGEKVYEFDVELPSNNNGKSCSEVAKTFGKRYTKDLSKNVYINNKLYIKGGCEKEQNCIIEDEPYQSACVEGKGIELYRVLTPQGNGGRTCEDVIKDRYKGEPVEVIEEGRKVTVKRACGLDSSSYEKYIQLSVLIAVAIIVVVLVLFLVQ